MKTFLKVFLLAVMVLSLSAFKPVPCGKYKGRNIYKGEKGGCYYMKGKKKVHVYIDKKFCKC